MKHRVILTCYIKSGEARLAVQPEQVAGQLDSILSLGNTFPFFKEGFLKYLTLYHVRQTSCSDG